MKKKTLILISFVFSLCLSAQVGINTVTPISIFHIDGKHNDAATPTALQLQDDFIVTDSATVGIGAKPNSYAALDVSANNKGILIPRVNLTSSTMDLNTDGDMNVSNQPQGLLIYNTGTAFAKGYYFWDGTQWRVFVNATSAVSSAVINCTAVSLSPSQQVMASTPLVSGTVLQIPYTGGNGGSYTGVTLTSIGNPNVTATISSGMLSVGNGMLTFTLSGTPTLAQQAPTGIKFDLTPFLTANSSITGCSQVVVGDVLSASIQSNAVMGYLMMTTDSNDKRLDGVVTKGYTLQANSPDGKYSIRVRVPDNQTTIVLGNQFINVQLRNNQSTAQNIIWNYSTVYSGGLVSGANTLTVPSQVWGGNNADTGGIWANGSSGATDFGGYWGNVGIYDGTGPEYRRYTWIPIGAGNKVCYEANVMAALDTTTPSTAVAPTNLKVYIRFQQVTAP